MKKVLLIIFVLAVALALSSSVSLAKNDKPVCTTIQDQTLTYSTGHYLFSTPLTLGFDPFGYNYQGHMYNGSYANAYLGRAGFALFPQRRSAAKKRQLLIISLQSRQTDESSTTPRPPCGCPSTLP